MTKEEIQEITFNPSEDQVLGMFDNKVHVRVNIHKFISENEFTEEPAVLIIPVEEYQRTWLNYLKRKQEFCENWGHYCGVFGYVWIEEGVQGDEIILQQWNPKADDDKEETWFTIDLPAKSFVVTKFSDTPDMEHG